MSRNKLTQLAALLFVLAIALPALAGSASTKRDKPLMKGTFDLSANSTLAGTAVKAGTYSVTADESKISFWSGKTLVAEAAIQWRDLGQKADQNTLIADSGNIREIQFEGKSRSAVIQ